MKFESDKNIFFLQRWICFLIVVVFVAEVKNVTVALEAVLGYEALGIYALTPVIVLCLVVLNIVC